VSIIVGARMIGMVWLLLSVPNRDKRNMPIIQRVSHDLLSYRHCRETKSLSSEHVYTNGTVDTHMRLYFAVSCDLVVCFLVYSTT